MNLIKYLPVENVVYKTELKEDEVIRRLSDSIEAEKNFRFRIFVSSSSKPYEGKINSNKFEIKRIINYRNSFLPRIKGEISKESDKTIIKVKMKLHPFLVSFLSIWFISIGFVTIILLLQLFINATFNPLTLIPFIMLMFAYVLTMFGFKFESNRSKKDLQKIFKAEIIIESDY
ncbi:MAG: hypothetical protein ACK4IX_15025 [Candidatus Sericytochromatia bacterium]